MSKPWSQYQQVVVETYAGVKAGKSSRVHVRPVAGQPFPTTMDVECSRSMRKLYPVGTQFRIPVPLFEQNIHAKRNDPQSTADIGPLLGTGYTWQFDTAASMVQEALIERLPGESWNGAEGA